MRTFNENLDAYHALNALNDAYVQSLTKRLKRASGKEEVNALMREDGAHAAKQRELYEELGKEMVKIMDVKWWQFWK